MEWNLVHYVANSLHKKLRRQCLCARTSLTKESYLERVDMGYNAGECGAHKFFKGDK